MNSRLVVVFSCFALILGIGGAAASELPILTITNQATNLIISWPTLPRWVLEESSSLQPETPWSPVSPDFYQTDSNSGMLSAPILAGSRFFRLRKTGLSVSGLKGYWSLDEGTGANSEDGTEFSTALLFTNASWGTGRLGPGALRFNGSAAGPDASRAWVSNDNYRVLPPAENPFSLSLWLNPEALPLGLSGVAGNNVTGTNGWQLTLNNAGPGTNFFVFSSAGLPNSLSITGRFLLLPGQWHQLTVTHDGDEGSIYLDSALLARGVGSLQTHDGVINFGGGVGGLNSFLGRIDDLRLYTNCLSHEQIALTGDWRFDESSAQVCADSSIQGRIASITNAAARVEGRNGTGIDLSKSSLRISNDDYAVLPPNGGSFSLSFWLKPNSLDSGEYGLLKLGEGPIGGWELAVANEGPDQTSLSMLATNAGGTLDLTVKVPFTVGNWTKIDITFNGGIATLFANGKQLRAESGAIRGTKAPLLIGAVPGLPSFDGVIDDLKIYSRERGPSEIGPLAATMWETVIWNSSTNMQLQGSGPPGRTLTYSIVPIITPTNGTVTLAPGSSEFSYAAGSRKGPDAFTYTVSDGEFTSDPAIVTMSVVEPHYLSPTGGWLAPLDGSSPLQAWLAGPADAMDAILKTNSYYDCFFYAPGEYQTRGWKYLERQTAHTGCKHVGSGAEGNEHTILKLVDIWEAWGEEVVFGTLDGVSQCDNFEVRQMIVDCNATNIPKYYKGEPVWIRVPISGTGQIDKVSLRWDASSIYGNTLWHLGRAREFDICMLKHANGLITTNCISVLSTGQVDTISVGANVDEIIVKLKQRANGIDFYALAEIQVSGSFVSLPTATQSNGMESRSGQQYPITSVADGNPGTAWASGPETEVQLTFPFANGSMISGLNLHWNCQNVPSVGRFGPASGYSIRAREESTGLFIDVPFVSHGRASNGLERITFGNAFSTNVITTDSLMLLLSSREGSIDFYSLKEATAWNGPNPVSMRLPSAMNALPYGDYHILRAFDANPVSQWASGLQGSVGAAMVSGNNLKFTDLKIVGFGTTAWRECFAMFLSPLGPATHHLGNVLVERCVFTAPAPVNKDGVTALSLLAVKPRTLTNAVVRQCLFSGLQNHFTYSQAMQASHVEESLVEDCQRAVYFEPETGYGDDVGPVCIRSNRFENVSSGVFLYMHPASRFESIALIGNEIVLKGSGGWGLASCDVCDPGQNGTIDRITVLDNVIRYPGWVQQPNASDGGLLYSDIRHAVFGNNLLALGSPNLLRVRQYPAGFIPGQQATEDCDHPGPFSPTAPTYPPSVDDLQPGYKRAWFNNQALSGATLGVRHQYFGTERPAAQQQWPAPFFNP